jgi:hypothetical protein
VNPYIHMKRFEEIYGPEYLRELRKEELNELWDDWQWEDEHRPVRGYEEDDDSA